MSNSLKELKIYGELSAESPYNIVIRHPLANEKLLLEKLGITEADCRTCDIFWVWENEMYFVSFASYPEKMPFVSYHQKEDVNFWKSFYVVTQKFPLSIVEINNALNFLVDYINRIDLDLLTSKHSERPVIISDLDICI